MESTTTFSSAAGSMIHDIRDTDVVLVNKIKAILKEKSNDANANQSES
jgi:hypothetical protein